MKILIRKAKKGDGKGIAESFNEGLKRGFNIYTGRNFQTTKKLIKKTEKDLSNPKRYEFMFIAIDKEENKIIGSAMFGAREKGRLRHRGELGWGVHPDYARKGVATKLVKAVIAEATKRGYKKVQAEAAIQNIASVKLAKKFGFKIEGKRKCGMLIDNGKYVDTYLFGKIL